MKKLTKLLAVVLVMVMLVSALPMVSVSAAEAYTVLELDTPTEVSVAKDEPSFLSFTPQIEGWYRFYSESAVDPYISVYDEDDNEIAYGDDEYGEDDNLNFSIKVYLEADCHYLIEIGRWGVYDEQYSDVTVFVTKEADAVSMEITQYPYDMTCVRGMEYETADFTGLEVLITMNNGEEISWSYEDDYFDADALPVDVEIYFDENDDVYVEVFCGGVSESFYLEVVENPVKSISVYSSPDIVLYEDTDCYYDDYIEAYIYDYYLPDDMLIKVEFTDGTYEIVSVNDYTSMGIGFYYYDYQYDEQWAVGDNAVYIEHCGAETVFYVSVIESPVVSYEVTSNPTKQYILGDQEYGWIDVDGYYYLWPCELDGLEFTLNFKDGTSKTYDADDFDFENGVFDGTEKCEIYYTMVEEAGEVTAQLCVYGTLVEYTVEVIESDVEKIEVIKDPDRTEYEYCYFPDFTGMQVKITYKDNSTEVITADSDTLVYETAYMDSLNIYLKASKGNIYISEEGYFYDGEDVYHELFYRGVVGEYRGIKYIHPRDVDEVTLVSSFDGDIDGETFHVSYTDGSEDTLTFDVLSYFEYDESYLAGYARTENGVTYYEQEKYEYDDFTEYIFNILFTQVTVTTDKYMHGDANCDGDISVLDATAIQMHLASINLLSPEGEAVADTDGDGLITVLDATRIQRFIALLIPEL